MQILFKFNGKTVRKNTKDVEKAILDVKPEQLHTDMFVTIKNGKQLIERHVQLIPAKRIFSDDFYREVFINNLYLA